MRMTSDCRLWILFAQKQHFGSQTSNLRNMNEVK